RDANASGDDVWIRRSTDGIDGWLGYSLAWVWSSRSAVPGQVDFKGRHLLSTCFSAPLREHTWIGLRLAYGAGLPYSAFPLDVAMERGYTPADYAVEAEHIAHADRGGTETAPLLHSPDEPFLRLDAEISQHWTTRRAGRTMEIAPYLRILN